jgi:hypothetical protein
MPFEKDTSEFNEAKTNTAGAKDQLNGLDSSASQDEEDHNDAQKSKKNRAKKVIIFLVLLIGIIFLSLVILLALNTSGGSNQESNTSNQDKKQAEAGETTNQEEQLTAEAINELQDSLKASASPTPDGKQSSMKYREEYFTGDGRPQGSEDIKDNGSLASQAQSTSNIGQVSQSETKSAKIPVVISVRYAPVKKEKSSTSEIQANTDSKKEGSQSENLPPFNTKLPVHVAGSFFAPASSDSIVVLPLNTDVKGEGWSLSQGTLMVGRVKGIVARKRIEVSIFGYVDPKVNKLVRLNGDVMGSDAAIGLPGEIRNAESIWKKFGKSVMQVATSIGSSVAGGYISRGVIPVFNPELYGQMNSSKQDQTFVEVEAGTSGYVVIKSLPPEANANGPENNDTDELARRIQSLISSEVK